MLFELAVALIFFGIVAYVVLGGADFGVGFWDLMVGGARRGVLVRVLIKCVMFLVWEVNYVWLIFVLVMLWMVFFEVFGSIMFMLVVLIFLVGFGIVLRGAAFVLKGEAVMIGEVCALGVIFALSFVLVLFFFGIVVGVIAVGCVLVGNAVGDAFASWTGFMSILVGLILVVIGAHFVAVFFGVDVCCVGCFELVGVFCVWVFGFGVVAGVLAIVGLVVVRLDALDFYDGLIFGFGLVCVIVSALVGVAMLVLEWRECFELACYIAVIVVGAIVVGWVVV